MANNYAAQAASQKFYYISGELEKLQSKLESLLAEHNISRETVEGRIVFGLLSEVVRIQISARKLTITVDDGPLDSDLPRINTDETVDGPAARNVLQEDFSGRPAELSSVEVTGPCGGGQKLEIVSTANTAAHGSIFD